MTEHGSIMLVACETAKFDKCANAQTHQINTLHNNFANKLSNLLPGKKIFATCNTQIQDELNVEQLSCSRDNDELQITYTSNAQTVFEFLTTKIIQA